MSPNVINVSSSHLTGPSLAAVSRAQPQNITYTSTDQLIHQQAVAGLGEST